MTRRLHTIVTACLGIAALLPAPALAQTPGRCTGLFCDLYYAGKPAPAAVVPGQPAPPEPPDPTHLPCHDFLCAAFGGRTPDALPPPPEPVAAPEPTKPVKAAKRRHKMKAVASADASQPDAGKAGDGR